MDGKFSWKIQNDPSNLEDLAGKLEEIRSACQLPESFMYPIHMAIEEVLSNIMHHAYRDEASHDIRIRIEFCSDVPELILEVEDDGIPFNPLDHSDPDIEETLEERVPGNLGIFLIKHYMDKVEYRRSGRCNILRMRKKV